MSLYTTVVLVLFKNRYILQEEYYTTNDYIQIKNILKEEYRNFLYERLEVDDVKKIYEKEIPLFFYSQVESKDLKEANGMCNFFIRKIIIKEDLEEREYLISLAHERLHLYYFSGCERFIQYQTFIFLYENECDYLRHIGVYFALEIFEDIYPDEYNCIGQIINYFIGG